ncbi:glutamate N-acetyltransferase/amino-acid N-acetyltransferase [Pullulanibacillus pueri]|uniref:Arginine biosynthesis bifunctional protein ArgJ n=1 Tax=Pullulanibacillus pueri TaxID=1437324 RepID=A0A8J2ZY57_9BACL|nr:bifunctional ornithine acetyltransferase/N-acetylglutamate synthase [Pullulanibacillus pueri]MBM7683232.1 glutamate N-acetyltransferase/amino-acid N-acetyltransferase [Pullulanibacillus pueri]GGH85502.1 arginine biosynthesis bifunctional protein ArgJ [Pullulanibacillus pueri]
MTKATVSTEHQDYKVIHDGNVASAKGFSAGGLHCGLKYKNLDLGWIYSEVPANAAGVYTTNVFQAAPLQVTQESLKVENKLQSIVVNSAIANAVTGKQGLDNAYEMRHAFADHLSIADHYVAVVSTGVIGDQLPMDKVKKGIQEIALEQPKADHFAQAILTTDTCTKQVAVELDIDGETVTIGGVAKGSGMIHPNMATMLSFITTDAAVDQSALMELLKGTTNETFNMITVDGDTSTNDMVLVLANGQAKNNKLNADHPQWPAFVSGFHYVAETLAKKIARDGEGATKLVEVQVKGAATEVAAKEIAKAIVGSNLVKSAIYGTDANWGRIVCAVGYSGVPFSATNIKVAIGPIVVVEEGLPVPFNEEAAKNYLMKETVQIFVEFQEGEGTATAWGCDLTYDYVRINASYRT